MQQTSLSKWLKFIIVGVGICGLILYAIVFPMLGQTILSENENFRSCFWFWTIFIWMTGIPCYIVLVFAWKIAANIGAAQSFSLPNAQFLKWISALAAGDTAFFFAGNIVFLILDMSHPVIVLFSLVVAFAGVAISVAAAALSHLALKAADLQNESDLTI